MFYTAVPYGVGASLPALNPQRSTRERAARFRLHTAVKYEPPLSILDDVVCLESLSPFSGIVKIRKACWGLGWLQWQEAGRGGSRTAENEAGEPRAARAEPRMEHLHENLFCGGLGRERSGRSDGVAGGGRVGGCGLRPLEWVEETGAADAGTFHARQLVGAPTA